MQNAKDGEVKMSGLRKVAKSASLIVGLSLIGKVSGFLREALMASKFGVSLEADTYIIAITATAFVVSMISHSLNSTLIPVLSSIEEACGKKRKIEYINNITNILVVFSLVIIAISWCFSPLIIKLFAQGFVGEQFQLAVRLNRMALPIIMFIILTSIFSGFLQSEKKFAAPSSIGISLNLVFIFYFIFMGNKFGLVGLVVATIIAYLSQVFVQIPSLIKNGYKYKPIFNLKDQYVNKTIRLSIPVMIALAAQQINVITEKTMSSTLVEGSIAALSYAAKTSLIFTEIFVVSITTVIFPILTESFNKNGIEALKKVMIDGSKLIALITIPASVGMVVLSGPIIRLIFERGAFDSSATSMTSQAFMLYSVATLFIGFERLLQSVYYSLEDTKTPMVCGILQVGTNILFNFLLVKSMSHRGFALSTTIGHGIAFLVLYYMLNKKIGSLGLKKNGTYFLKISIASFLMGVIVNKMYNYLCIYSNMLKINETISLVFSVFLGGILYAAICWVLKVKEINTLYTIFKKKLRMG